MTAGRPGDAPVDDAAEALLDARTRAVAAPIVAASEGGERGLALVVAGERYAVAARAVRTVAELRRFTPLPHAPAHVAGLAAWGGVVVPVFHLRVLLGLSLAALPEYGRVVFVGEARARRRAAAWRARGRRRRARRGRRAGSRTRAG